MRRLSVVLGRMGTVFIAICLALAILTLIPPASFGMTMSGMRTLIPETYTFIGPSLGLNPQISVRTEINTNTTVAFYIFNLHQRELTEEILTGNLTQLEEFIKENASKVLLEENISGENVTLHYTPSGIVNASFVIANHSPHTAIIHYKIELFASIAPNVRIIPVITYLGPIGAILAGQWIFVKIKNRRRRV